MPFNSSGADESSQRSQRFTRSRRRRLVYETAKRFSKKTLLQGFVQYKHTILTTNISAAFLQRWWRGSYVRIILNREITRNQFNAALKVQSLSNIYFAKKRARLERDYTLKKRRVHIILALFAAKRRQKVKLFVYILKVHKKDMLAAHVLQNSYKRFIKRKKYLRKVKRDRQIKAAVLIQYAYRTTSINATLSSQRLQSIKCVTLLQSLGRMYLQRSFKLQVLGAAIRIQRWTRKNICFNFKTFIPEGANIEHSDSEKSLISYYSNDVSCSEKHNNEISQVEDEVGFSELTNEHHQIEEGDDWAENLEVNTHSQLQHSIQSEMLIHLLPPNQTLCHRKTPERADNCAYLSWNATKLQSFQRGVLSRKRISSTKVLVRSSRLFLVNLKKRKARDTAAWEKMKFAAIKIQQVVRFLQACQKVQYLRQIRTQQIMQHLRKEFQFDSDGNPGWLPPFDFAHKMASSTKNEEEHKEISMDPNSFHSRWTKTLSDSCQPPDGCFLLDGYTSDSFDPHFDIPRLKLKFPIRPPL